MRGILKRFADLPWAAIALGAKEKRFSDGKKVIRLVHFPPPFQEVDPCTRSHVGLVVQGSLEIEFAHSTIRFQEGDALSIPGGDITAHRAIVTEDVILFLVEPAEE